ncbi:MAG: hypothetical protein A3J76_01170 [Candidatus Moranbacteria bacterium RBG_13_45_13]|nr:MAG: hypothetical protein A3J76_01170 [Candidatus Moranbacteria bacterium RBG_13_45_13]
MSFRTVLSNKKIILSSSVVILSLFVSFATCRFTTPTVFGGRDQGAIATAAINLAKYKSFTFSTPASQDLFQKYGPGKALNYPGFDYTKGGRLVTRFPKIYIAYLAGFYKLFGLKGIQYANFIPLFLFYVLFWLTLRQFFSEKISFLGFLIALTFFPFLWFAKYALTEIFMLALVWTGVYFLLIYQSSMNVRYMQIALAAFALSALTRVEGIAFFFLAAIYILALQKKKIIPKPKNFNKYLLVSTLFLLIIYAYLNFPALLDSSKNIIKAFLPGSLKESRPSANLYAYLGRIFLIYNALSYLILGLAGIVYAFLMSSQAKSRDLQEQSNKPTLKISRLASLARNDKLIIFFILFPSYFYLISPQITLDDPWFLRRFVFAVFPALIFYSVYFLNRFFYHKIFLYVTLVVLIATNIAVSQRFINLSENKDLLPQVEKLSQKFGPDDLILVDRMATGSGFSLMSEPMSALYGKNAVYFFNADDLKYISQDRYKNIYLAAPLSEDTAWYSDLIKGKPFSPENISNNFLEPSEKKWALAQNVESKTFAGIWKIK